jgi:hypothetical protein
MTIGIVGVVGFLAGTLAAFAAIYAIANQVDRQDAKTFSQQKLDRICLRDKS